MTQTANRPLEVISTEEKCGHTIYQIVNERDTHYCVTKRPDGSYSCLDEKGERCKGTWNGGYCYHIQHCQDLETQPCEREEIDENDKALLGLRSIQARYDAAYEQWKRENGTERPTRFNQELWRKETYCCGHWWAGDCCLYGNHKL